MGNHAGTLQDLLHPFQLLSKPLERGYVEDYIREYYGCN